MNFGRIVRVAEHPDVVDPDTDQDLEVFLGALDAEAIGVKAGPGEASG